MVVDAGIAEQPCYIDAEWAVDKAEAKSLAVSPATKFSARLLVETRTVDEAFHRD